MIPSQRGTAPGIETPHPIGALLPGLLQDDEMVQRFTAGLDEVLAPLLLSLDNLGAHLDPALAPMDFVRWLAQWVGLAIDERWGDDHLRALVAGAVDLYRWRGTARGLRDLVAIYSGGEPEIVESGGAIASPTPGGTPPGSDATTVLVRVRVGSEAAVDIDRLDALVASAKPAHLSHRVEVVVG